MQLNWHYWKMFYCVSEWKSLSHIRLWNPPGQNTGVGSHSLFQGIFPGTPENVLLSKIVSHFRKDFQARINLSPYLLPLSPYVSQLQDALPPAPPQESCSGHSLLAPSGPGHGRPPSSFASGISKLSLTGHIQPATCFCVTHENSFHTLKWLAKTMTRRMQFHDMWKWHKIKMGPSVEGLLMFSWNMLAHGHSTRVCFPAAAAELSSHSRCLLTYKARNIYSLALCRKCLLTPTLDV